MHWKIKLLILNISQIIFCILTTLLIALPFIIKQQADLNDYSTYGIYKNFLFCGFLSLFIFVYLIITKIYFVFNNNLKIKYLLMLYFLYRYKKINSENINKNKTILSYYFLFVFFLILSLILYSLFFNLIKTETIIYQKDLYFDQGVAPDQIYEEYVPKIYDNDLLIKSIIYIVLEKISLGSLFFSGSLTAVFSLYYVIIFLAKYKRNAYSQN
ncbi:hypothetical protein [Mycoplasma sp. 1018B]|uniref:hypothetical protein n=1 Tax=Mycoplasma sp. 1018B TaxID=2967302 RepID=UPI00211BCDBA|nr:hypothetical protein [Mycoplasma sp. 1018B]UUM19136.1 hypothetical protein NPA14_02255 [Mycoplasma sp. 1018B]